MVNYKLTTAFLMLGILVLAACSKTGDIFSLETIPKEDLSAFESTQQVPLSETSLHHRNTGVVTANGWYEEEEIYYIDGGEEVGVTQRGKNELYLIGDNRLHQANVALFIPGEPGYSPHWNINLVHTAEGVTAGDILASPYSSDHFDEEGVLFDDAEDILDAEDAGLVFIVKPGVVVLCPIISEKGAEAPGNTQRSEDFPAFDLNAGF